MYFTDVAAATSNLFDFWTALAPIFPTSMTIQVENAGDVIEDTTGDLVTSWLNDAVDPIDCSGAGVYAAPVGACIDWKTDTILDAHRVRGRTFVVPIVAAQFQSDGSLDATTIGYLQDAADAFIAAESASFVVWHRPFAGSPAVGTRPARPAHDGGHGLVTSATVPDLAAVLRSRRD